MRKRNSAKPAGAPSRQQTKKNAPPILKPVPKPIKKDRRGKYLTIFTIGHSIRPMETFIELLRAHGVGRLVDVRTIPRSRHNPQFNREALPKSLHARKIHYTHLKSLGGLRQARQDSQNTGWRNASFRGFADYMQTPAFRRGLARLIELGDEEQVAVMCAEAVPWRCHRSLIADALVLRGLAVRHIMSRTRTQPHRLTSFARVQNHEITYPGSYSGVAAE